MRYWLNCFLLLGLFGCAPPEALDGAAPAQTEAQLPVRNNQRVQQFILKPTVNEVDANGVLVASQIAALERVAGVKLQYKHPMALELKAHVLAFPEPTSGFEAQRFFNQWKQQGLVEYAEPDQLMHTM